MSNGLLRMMAWRGLAKLLGGKTAWNVRRTDRILRALRSFRR
ncbi:MAG: hypothetical protein AAF390_06290 [Pseudomonadota bacterium]